MTLQTTLRKAMDDSRINATDLAREAEVKSSFIYDILSGKSTNPSPRNLAKLLPVLNISMDELIGVKTDNLRMKQDKSDYVEISSILVAASAGGGAVVLEEKQGEPYYFRRSWVRDRLQAKPDDLRMIFVQGDSMEPTLCQGDMILVDVTKGNPSPPGIFVLFDGLGLVAKRLEFLPHSTPPSIRIISDNNQYHPYERSMEETEIIGRVVWFAREI